MPRLLIAISLLATFGCAANAGVAQGPSVDPLAVAVRHVLAEKRLLDLGEALVIENTRFAWRDSLSGEIQERIAALAASLDARVGSIETLLRCQPGPPPPEMFGRGWCRMEDDVRALVQIGEPKETDNGWEIPITTFGIYQAPPDRYSVYGDSGTLFVSLCPDGEWGVAWGPIRSAAHWP